MKGRDRSARSARSLLLCLGVAACGSPGLRPAGGGWGDAPAVTSGDYVLGDPAILGLTGDESLAEAGQVIASRLSASDGQAALKIYSTQIIGLPRGAVVLTRDGLADDAMARQQHVVEFHISPETGAATATGFGTRQTCRRGADAGTWTNRPCP